MDDTNQWVGSISSEDLLKVELADGVKTLGGAGTVVAINCRTIHGSGSNESQNVRSLPVCLFFCRCISTDGTADTYIKDRTDSARTAARLAHLDASYCPVPPDWESWL